VCLLAQGAQAVSADIVFVVDESGSMGTVQANIRNNIGAFATYMSNAGIDATYALVGYGNSNVRPRLLTDFTTAANFATAASGLMASGGTEPGYEAIMAALEGGPSALSLTYRSGAVKNVIIVSDEESNNGLAGADYADVNALLTRESALLNGIIAGWALNTSSDGGGTYPLLIAAHGGTVFNLNTFNTTDQNVIDAFVLDFAARKIKEIQDFEPTVPEPGTIALLGLGLAGLVVVRRRRR
jgi:hypothetical protein